MVGGIRMCLTATTHAWNARFDLEQGRRKIFILREKGERSIEVPIFICERAETGDHQHCRTKFVDVLRIFLDTIALSVKPRSTV